MPRPAATVAASTFSPSPLSLSLSPPLSGAYLSLHSHSLFLSPPNARITEVMIKRRFYKQEHGDNSGSSDSSSSEDSDSSPEVDAEEDHEVEEEEEQGKENDKRTRRYSSPGSGYESEDSSNNQCDNDASDLLTNEEDESGEKDIENIKNGEKVGKVPDNEVERASEMTAITMDPNDPVQTDISNFILKFKSVFKCRLCPRILCLNETVVRTHLSSKRHARSKKLHGEGRLKLMLNSDGELEEEQETHAERHARILALSQKPNPPKRKDNGRQRQNQRRKKRMRGDTNKRKSEPSIKNSAKKRRTLHTKEL